MDAYFTLFLVAAGAVALAIAAVLWALRATDGARGAEARWRDEANRSETKLQRWDSLMGAFPGVAIVWEPDGGPVADGDWGEPRIFGSPVALASLLRFSDVAVASPPAVRILQGLAGFKAADPSGADAYLAPATTRLRTEGEAFSLVISGVHGLYIEIDGRTAGPRAVVWITDSAVRGAESSGGRGRLDAALHQIARDPAAFADMLAAAPFLAFRLSSSLRLEWANAAYAKALGAKSPDQAIDRNLVLDAAATDQARRALETGAPVEETRYASIGGARRALRIHMAPVAGGVGAMAFDVTEAQVAREELDRVLQGHDETLDAVREAIAVFGPDQRLIYHNRAFADLWSLDAAFLADRPSHGAFLDHLKKRRLTPPHANYAEWRATELFAYEHTGELAEATWDLPQGRTLRVAKRAHPLGGLLMVMSDITDEMQLKSQYAALVQAQGAALDRLHEGVVVFGLDGRMRLFNAAFAEMWRIRAEDLAGEVDFRRMTALLEPLHHDRAEWARVQARISDPDPDVRHEQRVELRRSDGAIISMITRPLPDGATLIAFLDITATKRVEEALRERAEAFEQADRLKTELVENVSYQLRTPLQTIHGYAEVLAKLMAGPLNDRQRDQLQMILAASESLSKLIDNVLDVALIEAGRLELQLSDVAVEDIVAEAAALSTGKAQEREVTLKLDAIGDLGRARLDPQRIKQVMINLLSNAIRFSEPGGEVRLRAERTDGMLRICVSDDGAGMSLEDQAAAFDHFVSGDRRGAGLGLALVRSFVELHGGWVSLKSDPGAGVVVNCYLPVEELAAAGRMNA